MQPTNIRLKKADNVLELTFTNASVEATPFTLPAELLRVLSPSAEVRGHSPDQTQLQVGKKYVRLTGVEAVGHYAIKLVFDDGHDSGLYTWDYLYDLCAHQDRYWQEYLVNLAQARKSRDPHESIVQFMS